MTRVGMRFQRLQYAQVHPAGLRWVLLSLLGLLGCGGLPPEEPAVEPVARSSEAALLPSVPDVTSLLAGNGLSTNGLSTNGLSTNGLSTNGLSTNGLSTHGLSTSQFIGWFDQDPALSTQVVQYIVRCALPAGQRLQWTHPVTGLSYQWEGSLGLAPGWALGLPPSEPEQQVITACLAALTNKYGLSLPISVLGLDAAGVRIPLAPDEPTLFPVSEACFFGNLFKDEGIFAGNSSILSRVESSARACGLEAPRPDGTTRCAPIQHVGRCHDNCVFDGTGSFFPVCFRNGRSYRALSTRLRKEDLYRCGDRVCQVSESCGTELTPDNCSDCGPCPTP